MSWSNLGCFVSNLVNRNSFPSGQQEVIAPTGSSSVASNSARPSPVKLCLNNWGFPALYEPNIKNLPSSTQNGNALDLSDVRGLNVWRSKSYIQISEPYPFWTVNAAIFPSGEILTLTYPRGVAPGRISTCPCLSTQTGLSSVLRALTGT